MSDWNSFQFKRLKLVKSYDDGFYLTIRYLFLALGILSVLIVGSNYLGILPMPKALLSLSFFFLSPALLIAGVSLYISYLKTHPEYDISPAQKAKSFQNNFDFDALWIIYILANSKNWQLFWGALSREPGVAEVIYRLGLQPENLASLQKSLITQTEADGIVKAALSGSEGHLANRYDVLKALFASPEIEAVLTDEKITANDVAGLLLFYQGISQSYKSASVSNNRTGGIGKSWATSYTNLVDSVTYTIAPSEARLRTLLMPIFSRQKIVDELTLEMLKSAGQNIMLVGEQGIGKTEIFYHFASKILLYQTKTELDGRDLRILDVPRLLSLASSAEELQRIMERLFGELSRAGNIILFIDQIDLLLEPSGKLGTVDMSSLLQGYLQLTNVIIVGAISTEKYLKLVKPSAILDEAFTAINISEPDRSEALGIVLSHVRGIEYRYGVFFLLESLKAICSLSERYLKGEGSPERELRLLEEVAATAHTSGQKIVAEGDVVKVVEQKAQVPLQIDEKAKETLENLEEKLHQRVIGQNYAIKEVSDALIRARAGLSTGNKPVGTFLFLGPTGVGKTETAKALAAIYFGSEQKMIRLDMSEYADQTSLHKLLGTDAVNDPGSLTIAIQQNPSAVMLFDEIEKSNDLVKNALLQLLDEGKITTNYGKVLDFSNTIVIATSNAGSDFIRSQIQSGGTVASFEKPLIDQLISQKIFLTEFLNRFDGVIVYTPLSKDEIKKVVGLQVAMLEAKLQKEKGITLELSNEVIEQLAIKGYDPVFGARALQRVIKNDLETAIAKEIVSQSPQPGTKLTISSL